MRESMLITTGRKEKLSVSKGSEIEISSDENEFGTGDVWYCAILDENLARSKRRKLSVRHLDPHLKQAYSPPFIKTTVHRLIRPVPPTDPFPDLDFEEGDFVDAAHKASWWSGSVVKVLGNRRYLVYLRFEPDVIEIERKDLRPHLVWKDDEWFRCQKEQLIESDFSAGKSVEVRTKVDNLGDVWAPATAIRENEDGTILVKLKTLSEKDITCTKMSIPYSKIRPPPPPCGLKDYNLMEKVDAFLVSGWCPGVVNTVLSQKIYAVVLGRNKKKMKFSQLQLRPSLEWKDGVWQTEEKVLDSEESPHAEGITASSHIRVTVRPVLRDQKTPLATGGKVRATRTSARAMQNLPPPPSNGGDVAEAGRVSVTVNETLASETAAQLSGELGSKLANVVINENTQVTSQPEIAATKPAGKTHGKTSRRKKLQSMKNQKGSANDFVGEKAPEEINNRESVNKRKRGPPGKFISTEPKQKTGQSAYRTPVPMLDSVVEKHVDVVETPPARESTMVLPFVKKSPLWKVLESMEVFKGVPQHPHFSPLLESEEEFREGNAIGTMVMYTGLLEKVNNLQVDDPISSINRIDECFLKVEKHGFNVTAPRSRIAKVLSIKESQTRALDELKALEEEITENDNKRMKYEEEIVELQRQEASMKEAKGTLEKEIARMKSHVVVLDQEIQNVDQELRAIVTAPWN